MKEFTTLILVLLLLYLVLAAFIYLFQRSMIYFPVPPVSNFSATEVVIENQGVRLQGWVLNPGKSKALLYFGGNAEQITYNREFFEDVFHDYSVYLIDYRGYGKSQGKPSEAALFADAVAIYDHLSSRHTSITAFGRSLGSAVAVYLAAQRRLKRLILLTPFDRGAAVAQRAYPIFPMGLLLRDRFDLVAYAEAIRQPVLIVAAEQDRIVPPAHARALERHLLNAAVRFVLIPGAGHNDISEYPGYSEALRAFIAD